MTAAAEKERRAAEGANIINRQPWVVRCISFSFFGTDMLGLQNVNIQIMTIQKACRLKGFIRTAEDTIFVGSAASTSAAVIPAWFLACGSAPCSRSSSTNADWLWSGQPTQEKRCGKMGGKQPSQSHRVTTDWPVGGHSMLDADIVQKEGWARPVQKTACT